MSRATSLPAPSSGGHPTWVYAASDVRLLKEAQVPQVPQTLDASAVRAWCGLALEALGRAREEIDAINVYPVADGDTGTNLYLTVESAAAAVEAVFAAHAAVSGGTGGPIPFPAGPRSSGPRSPTRYGPWRTALSSGPGGTPGRSSRSS